MTDGLLSVALDEVEDIFYVCSADGDWLEWNAHLPRVTGYSDGELDSLDVTAIFSTDSDEISGIDRAIEWALESDHQHTVKATLETKGGTLIPYKLSLVAFESAAGDPRIAGIGRDITDELETERRVTEMATTIRELSMPVVEVWDGVILTTIVGALDTRQAEQLTEDLLDEIVETEAEVALIDITGVPALDTATAQHLIDTVTAANLIGSRVIITGISPDIAQTLVQLGITLEDVETQSSLIEGLRVALSWQGVTFD